MRGRSRINEPATAGTRAAWKPTAFLATVGVLVLGGLAGTAAPRSPVCDPTYPLIGCVKTVSITKSFPRVVLLPPAGVRVVIRVRVNTNSGTQPGFACPSPAAVLGGAVNVQICDPLNPGTPIAVGNVAMPGRPAGFVTGVFNVNVFIPGGTPTGVYTVKADVPVNFGADSNNPPQLITGRGDTQICIVDPAPQDPNLPRLDLDTVSDPMPNCPPGAQFHQVYRVTNNDPVHAVTLDVIGESRQNARMPDFDPGNPGTMSAYSISSAVSGDDFPIEFVENLPANGVLSLPPNPSTYVQPPITKQIVLAPGTTQNVEVATRSYPGCSDGSCAEYLFTVQGTFADASPALACVGGGLNVVNSNDHPSSYCTGKTNSLGCVPFMSFNGAPSVSATSAFRIQCNDAIPGEAAFLFYSFGKSNLNFHGGKLCVKSPLRRLLPPKAASATGPPPCSGVVKRNFNNAIQTGSDPLLTAGAQVRTQWFQRDPADPAGFGDALSNGLSFVIGP